MMRTLLLGFGVLGCFQDRPAEPRDASLPDLPVALDRTPPPDVSAPPPDAPPPPDVPRVQCRSDERLACYLGPDGTLNVGTCRPGTFVCRADGTWDTACEAQVTPVDEVCNGLDDDCDGAVDELDPLRCGVGPCARTAPACVDGRPNVCVPGAPSRELCNGVDEDCDGVRDDDDPDATRACASTREDRLDGRCWYARCEEVACPRGFANCDGDSRNGCERDVRYDFNNCGGCGVRAGDGEVCFDGIRGTIEQVSSVWGETCVIVNPGGRVACMGEHHGTWGSTGMRTLEALPGIEGAVAVRTGGGSNSHGCVITERAGERRLYCWGLPTEVMPGRQHLSGVELAVPVEVSSLRGLRDVVVGQRHVCALTTGGYLWCLGGFVAGPIVRNADGARLVPGLTDVREATSDGSANDDLLSYVCARSGDGLVRCFGQQLPWHSAGGFGAAWGPPIVLNDLTEVTWVRAVGRSVCFGHADRAPECANILGRSLVPEPVPMYPFAFHTRAMPRSGPREVVVFGTFACSLDPTDGSFERCWGPYLGLNPIPGDAPYQRVDFGIPAALGTVRRGEVEIAGEYGARCAFRRGRAHLLCYDSRTSAYAPIMGSRPLPP